MSATDEAKDRWGCIHRSGSVVIEDRLIVSVGWRGQPKGLTVCQLLIGWALLMGMVSPLLAAFW